MNEPIALVPNKPDREIAAELREIIIKAYDTLLPVLQEAHNKGFIVNAGTGVTPMGKVVLNQLQILREYK